MFIFQSRVLVTHGLSYLPKVDQIVVLVNGQVSEVGTYEELLERNQAFAEFLKNYMQEEKEDDLKSLSAEGL